MLVRTASMPEDFSRSNTSVLNLVSRSRMAYL